MKMILTLSLLLVGSAFAQQTKSTSGVTAGQIVRQSSGQAWQIPFASTDNTISLSIQNSSRIEAKNVSVAFGNFPSWIKFKSSTFLIKSIASNASKDAEFEFSIDKKAPIGRDTTLTATITIAANQTWTKEIKVSVAAPKDYKTCDNFPNPFNPSTKIAFELPKASHVNLIIYDIVGREVAQVADGDYPAGYSELTWNGANKNGAMVSSGVYFYRIGTDKWSKVKKMMVVR